MATEKTCRGCHAGRAAFSQQEFMIHATAQQVFFLPGSCINPATKNKSKITNVRQQFMIQLFPGSDIRRAEKSSASLTRKVIHRLQA